MLLLDKLNCEYISLTSPQLAEVITDFSSVESISLTATRNCCLPSIVGNIDLSLQQWNLNFPVVETLNITTIKIKNIITGEIFEVLNGTYLVGDYSCATGDISNLFTVIQDWFTTNTATTVTQSYDYDIDTNTCIYTIKDLPTNYIMLEMTVTGSCNDLVIPFTYAALENIFIDDNILYITPQLFNTTKFTDGIYKFFINIVFTNGDVLQLAACFFYDCETKCLVSKQIDKLKTIGSDDMSVFLMHYVLTESSNCNCNCDELCVIWEELNSILCKDLNCQNCGCN